jgi:Peptidase A4 family
MKAATLLCAALFAVGTFGAVGTVNRRARASAKLATRGYGGVRGSKPRLPAIDTDGAIQALEFENETKNTSHVEYSSNWAGAVLIGSGYTMVTGTIKVPTPKMPSGGSSRTTYYTSAWVGIDGDTCGSAILQTGVDFIVKGNAVSYDAWYEWYPDCKETSTNFNFVAC